MIHILCACNHPEILNLMERLVNQQDGWQSSKADSLASVIEILGETSFDVVLLGVGFGPEERATVEAEVARLGHSTKIVDHFGGGSGLLYSEVTMALADQ